MKSKYQKTDEQGESIGSKMNHIQKRMTEQVVAPKKKYNRNKEKQNWKQFV